MGIKDLIKVLEEKTTIFNTYGAICYIINNN